MSDAETKPVPASWRIILAFFLDLLTAFIVMGFVVASISGGRTADGFRLNGLPAFIAFALIIAYFVIANRFFGSTLWKYILKARR
nr:hypothetical protein [uncultured Gellertiella sp.]